MNRPADFHTHSLFSSDSDAKPEENIKAAINLGLSSIALLNTMILIFHRKITKMCYSSLILTIIFQVLPASKNYIQNRFLYI